jgi:hypothetical protein
MEMPNGFSEETEDLPEETRPHEGRLTAIRLRDVKTGQFVAGAGLIQKGFRVPKPKPTKPVDTGMIGGADGEKLQLEAFRAKNAKNRAKAAEMRRKAFGGEVEKSRFPGDMTHAAKWVKITQMTPEQKVGLASHLGWNSAFRKAGLKPPPRKNIAKTFIPGRGYISAARLVEVGGKGALREAVQTQKKEKRYVKYQEEKHFKGYKDAHEQHKKAIAEIARDGKEVKSPVKGVRFLEPGGALAEEMKRGGMEGFAIKAGSRRGGDRVMVAPRGSTKNTIDHEVAHLAPKRSGYRFYTVVQNGKTTMREEARADMATRHRGSYYDTRTSGKKAQSGYVSAAKSPERQRAMADWERSQEPYNGLFQRESQRKFSEEPVAAYREVQDKIYNSRVRSGKPVFHGNKYVDDHKRRRAYAATIVGAPVMASGGYGYHKFKKRNVSKKFSLTGFKGVAEGVTAGSIGGIVANQFPQNRTSSKKSLKKVEKLDPKLSVTLKKKEK